MSTLSFRLDAINPKHVHVSVLAGPEPGSRSRAGNLTLRHDEWDVLRRILQRGDVYGELVFDRLELRAPSGL